MVTHSVGVATDVDDMAVVQHSIDDSCRHHFVAEYASPLIECSVRSQHRGGVLVAPTHQLEEQHCAGLADGDVADLIDDKKRWMAEDR